MRSSFSRACRKNAVTCHTMKMPIKTSKVPLMGRVKKMREAPAAQEQRAAEVFFQHRAEDEAQHERRGIEIQAQEHVADEAERRR